MGSNARTAMDKLGRPCLLSLAILLVSLQLASQQRPPRPPSSDFNIELINLEAPSFMASVPGAGARSGYIAQANLRRISAWKPSEEVADEVAALRVGYWLEEGAVRVEVTAYLGQTVPFARLSELQKLRTTKVASHLVREDETVSVSETERFGIEPFMVKVVRAGLWNGFAEIVNKTQALWVTTMAEERPVFMMAVRNVSHKHIDAIRWYGLENGRKRGGSAMSGGRLIRAGGVFEIRQHFGLEKTATANAVPQQEPAREIVIAAILFEDGTFEGEVDEAAEMAAGLTGLRIQTSKAVQLFKSISPASSGKEAAALSRLKREVASLGEEIDTQTVNELTARFANASEDTRKRRIREELKISFRSVKHDLRSEIEKFEYQLNHSIGQVEFGAWVKETLQNLEGMLGSN